MILSLRVCYGVAALRVAPVPSSVADAGAVARPMILVTSLRLDLLPLWGRQIHT